jgi:hypothetical protein
MKYVYTLKTGQADIMNRSYNFYSKPMAFTSMSKAKGQAAKIISANNGYAIREKQTEGQIMYYYNCNSHCGTHIDAAILIEKIVLW